MALPVSPARDPAASSVPSPWNLMVPSVSLRRDPMALPVSAARDPVVPSIFPVFVLMIPAATPAPAPVLRAAEPLFFRLVHLHPSLRRSPYHQHRQAYQSTAPPAVLLSTASEPRRAPTGPSSRFPLPGPFCALCPCLSAQAHGIPPSNHALSSPPPALPLDSGSASHLCRTPTGPSLFSSPQSFFLPTPALPLDSGSISHIWQEIIPCGGKSLKQVTPPPGTLKQPSFFL